MDIGISENGQILEVPVKNTMHIKSNVIINEDCLVALKDMPDKSVDCCITSPPYYGLRDYGVEGQIGREATPEQYVERLVRFSCSFTECFQIEEPFG